MNWVLVALAVVVCLGCVVTAWRQYSETVSVHRVLSNVWTQPEVPRPPMARDTGDDLDPDEEWPLPEGRGRSTSGSTIRRLVLGSQPFVGAKELAAEALHSEDYRARVLAANELVGWTNMHRERLKRTSAALAKIALFVGGAAGLFALTAEFSGGGGLLPGAVALGSGLLAALASAGWSRAARGEMRRMEDIVQRIASRVEKSKSTLPAPESSSPGESR